MLEYLRRYTHRVAVSNNRLMRCEDDQVSFRYKDYAHGNRRRVLTLEAGDSSAAFCRAASCASAITVYSPIVPNG